MRRELSILAAFVAVLIAMAVAVEYVRPWIQ